MKIFGSSIRYLNGFRIIFFETSRWITSVELEYNGRSRNKRFCSISLTIKKICIHIRNWDQEKCLLYPTVLYVQSSRGLSKRDSYLFLTAGLGPKFEQTFDHLKRGQDRIARLLWIRANIRFFSFMNIQNKGPIIRILKTNENCDWLIGPTPP